MEFTGKGGTDKINSFRNAKMFAADQSTWKCSSVVKIVKCLCADCVLV